MTPFALDPRRVGFALSPAEALRGQDATFNADVVRSVCGGQAGPIRDAVLLNAGIAMALVDSDAELGTSSGVPKNGAQLHERWAEGIGAARAAIDGGHARAILEEWVRATQE